MKHTKHTKYTQWNKMSAIICHKYNSLWGVTLLSHSPACGSSLQTPSCDSFGLQHLLGFVKPRYPGHARANIPRVGTLFGV